MNNQDKIEVKNEHSVLRRVPFTRPNYYKPDGSLSSFAFSLRRGENGLSVDLEHLTTHEESVQDRKAFHLYKLSVETVRQKGANCIHDPVEDNFAHALIVDESTLKKKSVKRFLAKNAERVL